MSIKGFHFSDGTVQKYDYNSLDNLPSQKYNVNWNLLKHTQNLTSADVFTGQDFPSNMKLIKDNNTIIIPHPYGDDGVYDVPVVGYKTNLKYNDYLSGTYTFSFDAYADFDYNVYYNVPSQITWTGSTTPLTIKYGYSDSGDTTRLDWYGINNLTITQTWTRYYITFSIPDNFTHGTNQQTQFNESMLYFIFDSYKPNSDDPVQIKNIKFEQGNHATDWMPHPEDLKNLFIN